MDHVKQALMRASTYQSGMESAPCSTAMVKDLARMDCPGSTAHAEMSEGVLYTSSVLHRFGLPYDYAKLEVFILPEPRPCCSAPLRDPCQHPSIPIASLLGSATRGDAEGTIADSKHTRSSRWRLNAYS